MLIPYSTRHVHKKKKKNSGVHKKITIISITYYILLLHMKLIEINKKKQYKINYMN